MTQKLCIKKRADYTQLPLIFSKNTVVFPHSVTPIYLSKESNHLNSKDYSEECKVFVSSAQESNGNLLGTVCHILRAKNAPNNKVKVILQGIERATVIKKHEKNGCSFVDVNLSKDAPISTKGLLIKKNLCHSIKKSLKRVFDLGKILSPQLVSICKDETTIYDFETLVINHLNLSLLEKQSLLSLENQNLRFEKINDLLCKEVEDLLEQKRLECQTKVVFGEMGRDNGFVCENNPFLLPKNQEGHGLQGEFKRFNIVKTLPLLESAKIPLLSQLDRLAQLPKESIEFNNLVSYFDHLIKIPWENKVSNFSLNINSIEKDLAKKHYGLENVKERILEYLSLKKLNPTSKGLILCLVGPPGVGKTSVGESVASALGKPFVRISFPVVLKGTSAALPITEVLETSESG